MFHRLRSTSIAACTLVLALVSAPATAQTPLGSAFTYQGQLNVFGQPLNGTADVQFKLYGAPTGGTQIGSTIQLSNVTVNNGLLTASLDFGPGRIQQDARWVEIAVRAPAGSGTFSTLGRQAIAPAPVAGFALKPWQFTDGNTWLDSIYGNVGVGTSEPHQNFRLHVTGARGLSPWRGAIAACGSTSAAVVGELNGKATIGGHNAALDAWDNLLINPGGGNVGIGNVVTTPQAPLHLGSTNPHTLYVESTSPHGTWFGLGNSSGPGGRAWQFTSIPSDAGSGGKLAISVGLLFGNPTRSVMTMMESGAVGIGTSTPAATLDVNGTTRTGVIVITGGSDVAEPYHIAPTAGAEPQPGMVVAIDPTRVGKMRLAANAYDRTVAGIISGANGIKPGITLTQTGTVADGDMPVASVGRVWCFCDADAAGPIEAGDMLTTSDTPGHAMKAADHARSQGAVLGKAMSSLKSGKGLVLVLVTLQ